MKEVSRNVDFLFYYLYIKDKLGFEDMTEIITRLGLFQRNDSDKEIEESEDTVDKTYDKLVSMQVQTSPIELLKVYLVYQSYQHT